MLLVRVISVTVASMQTVVTAAAAVAVALADGVQVAAASLAVGMVVMVLLVVGVTADELSSLARIWRVQVHQVLANLTQGKLEPVPLRMVMAVFTLAELIQVMRTLRRITQPSIPVSKRAMLYPLRSIPMVMARCFKRQAGLILEG